MKKIICLVLLFLCLFAVSAQDVAPHLYSDTEVLIAFGVSTAFQVATVTEGFFINDQYHFHRFFGYALLQNAPGLLLGTESAALNTGIQASLTTAALTTFTFAPDNAGMPLLFNTAHKFSMYAMYDQYAEIRQNSADEEYRKFHKYDMNDLLYASFNPDSFKEWYVWGYLASIATYSAVKVAMADQSNAVWNTGKGYIGDTEFHPAAAAGLMLLMQIPNFVFTGIGEETLYRASYYEEAKYRFGEWPAKIIDGLYFNLSHYPQKWDIISQQDGWTTAFQLTTDMASTWYFQYIYEWGGLPAVIAAHAWTDVIFFFADWLVQGGAPNNGGFAIQEKALNITFHFKF